MATSSAMSTSNQYIKYTISITQNSQSISDNTSNVTVKVRFYRTNTGYTSYGTGTVYCKINGTKYSASVTPDDKITNSGIVLFSKTLNISHGSDGKKKLTCSAWIDHNVVTSEEQSYSQTLTTIYRASEPTVSASTVKMGNTLTITTNRKSSDFTHTLKYTFGPIKGATIKTGVGASYAWKVPDLAQYCNNATSGKATITCITYNGSTKVGEETCDVTLKVQSASAPTATNVVMGNRVTVTTNRKSSNFTHKITWKFGSKSGTADTDATTSASFTASLDLAKEIKSKTSGTGTITCVTYNGTAMVGTETCEFTASVPNNDTTKPTASWTLIPTGSLPSAFDGVYIQGKTGVKADYTASSVYSTVSSYKMSVNGKAYSGDPATSNILTRSGSVSVTGAVTDARGFARALEDTITVQPYSTPILEPTSGDSSIVCERCLQDGTYDDAGTYLHIRCKLTYSPLVVDEVQKNTCILSFMYKAAGGVWSDETELFVSDSMSRIGTDQKLSGIVTETTKSYTVRLIVTDTIGSSEAYDFTLPTADVALHLGAGGYGVAVGKYSEATADDKRFEVAFDSHLYGDVYGRAYGLGKLTDIPENADLNSAEYKVFGCYAIAQNATAETISNLPRLTKARAGVLRVYSSTGSGNTNDGWVYITQEFAPYDVGGCYRRLMHRDGDDAEWKYDDWMAISGRDSVVVSGTGTTSAGITWYYKKWFNGTAECWARRSVDVDATTQWGTAMYYGSVSAVSLPFEFVEPPMFQVTVEKGTSTSSSSFFVASSGKGTTTTIPSVLLCRPTSAEGINVNVLYHVHGLWK